MKPIKDWDTAKLGYKFGDLTFYNSKHLGIDHIVPEGTILYAPFDGEIIWEGYGSQGGNTIHFKPHDRDVVIRFMHLSKFLKGKTFVNEGDEIALTGNTGSATTGAHLHTDISKGSIQINNFSNFINPIDYDWGKDKMCKIDSEKALHLRRNVVDRFIKAYYGREPSEKEIAAHADWIDRDSGNSFNYKGIGDWIANQVNEKEFKANWVSKKVADNATKVAQKKCDATIDKVRADYQKEKDGLQKTVADKEKSIDELNGLLTACQDEKKRLEILLGSTDEYTWVEHLALAIKKLFRKE